MNTIRKTTAMVLGTVSGTCCALANTAWKSGAGSPAMGPQAWAGSEEPARG